MSGGPILIVDDNVETTAALVAVLELRGYETISAHDGLDALGQLRDGLRPRLIVLDWLMPNLDGRGFLESVAADDELGSIPIIVYSALGSRVLARNVAAIISKADDPDVLLDVVARFAERASGS
jgi:sigma-B regulation protein RsbU (phosphoserine phosphatase)